MNIDRSSIASECRQLAAEALPVKDQRMFRKLRLPSIDIPALESKSYNEPKEIAQVAANNL
jgi:hypothetical protein